MGPVISETIPLEFEDTYSSLPDASLICLAGHASDAHPVIENSEAIRAIPFKMLEICIINMLISGQISMAYYKGRQRWFFNLLSYKTSGYYIYAADPDALENARDLLTRDFLEALKIIGFDSKNNLSATIHAVIQKYLYKSYYSLPYLVFTYRYLNADLNRGCRPHEDRSLWGLSVKLKIETDKDKLLQWAESLREYNNIRFYLRRYHKPFRHFLEHIEFTLNNAFREWELGD